MLNILCELNKITDVIGIITACLGSIGKQVFRVSHFNPAGIALTSFFMAVGFAFRVAESLKNQILTVRKRSLFWYKI